MAARSPASRKYCRKPEISTPTPRRDRARKECRQRQRRHHRDIEKDRRGGGTRKAVHDVEHAAIERHQRDQQQIGKGDSGQFDRKPALLGSSLKPGARMLIACGMNSNATASSTTCEANSRVKMRLANSRAEVSPPLPWTWA